MFESYHYILIFFITVRKKKLFLNITITKIFLDILNI